MAFWKEGWPLLTSWTANRPRLVYGLSKLQLERHTMLENLDGKAYISCAAFPSIHTQSCWIAALTSPANRSPILCKKMQRSLANLLNKMGFPTLTALAVLGYDLPNRTCVVAAARMV